MLRLNFFVAGAILLKHSLKIVKTYSNSEVKLVSGRHSIFEGSLAQKLRF